MSSLDLYSASHNQQSPKKWRSSSNVARKAQRFYWQKRFLFGLSVFGKLSLFAAAIYLIWVIVFSGFFLIKTIDVRGAKYYVSAARVEKALVNFKGRHLLTLSNQKAKEQLLEIMPELDGTTISKRFPATLVVEVKSYRPVAIWRQEYFEPRYLVAENGMIVASVFGEQEHNANLLNIFTPAEFVKIEDKKVEKTSFEIDGAKDDRTQGIEGIELGAAFDDAALVTALKPAAVKQQQREVPLELPLGEKVISVALIDQIQQLLAEFDYKIGVSVQEVWYFPVEDELHLVTHPGWRIKFALARDLGSQLGDMAAALTELNFVQRDFRYIDLRIANKIFICREQMCA